MSKDEDSIIIGGGSTPAFTLEELKDKLRSFTDECPLDPGVHVLFVMKKGEGHLSLIPYQYQPRKKPPK